jgi:hypothetical protein
MGNSGNMGTGNANRGNTNSAGVANRP